jgi:anti-sigma regulatory factor (Ser/Thr protein kinase)
MRKHVVRDYVDVLHVQVLTKRFAEALGFTKRECGELAIVASELSSNILKYGPPGSITLEAVEDTEGMGLTVIAYDVGPPFRNLDLALKDGWDDAGPIDPILMFRRKGMGGGLGAVVRLTDRMSVVHEAEGKSVVVVRYLKSRARH